MITEVSVGAFSETAVVADKLNEVIRALNAIETASTSDNSQSDAIAANMEFIRLYPDAEHTFGALKCHDFKNVFLSGYFAAKAHV